MIDAIMTHAAARHHNKSAFFFSRFNFVRMKERGNTHYCFACGGDVGFTPGPDGKPTNCVVRRWNPVEYHDDTHEICTIGNADKYDNPWDWLRGEIPTKGENFPFVVNIPSIS